MVPRRPAAFTCLRRGFGRQVVPGTRPAPAGSPFYQLVERFFPQFEAVYEECYQERYLPAPQTSRQAGGFWRPIIGTVVRKFLECGDLKHGFARVRCPKCHEELFVPFSCRVRCFCPSCHEKRVLEKAGWACLRQAQRARQVEKILRHCGLWEEQAARAPPWAETWVTG